MDQHPYYNVVVFSIALLTVLAAVDLVILGLWLWAQRRNTLASGAAMHDAIASVQRFEDELSTRRQQGGQSA